MGLTFGMTMENMDSVLYKKYFLYTTKDRVKAEYKRECYLHSNTDVTGSQNSAYNRKHLYWHSQMS